MANFSCNRIDYDSCVAFYEQRLSARRARRVQRWLRNCPEIAEQARREAAWRAEVRDHYADLFEEPLPPRLVAAAERDGLAWQPWAAVASAVTLAVVVGWQLGNSQQLQPPATSPATAQVAEKADGPAQPVSQIFNQLQHPNLSGHGYQLTAREVLRPGPRPLVEYRYTNEQGETVKIYARPRLDALAATPKGVDDNAMTPVRWHQNGVDYTLVNGPRALAPHALAQNKAPPTTQRDAMAPTTKCSELGHQLRPGCTRDTLTEKAPAPTASPNTRVSLSTQPQPVAR